VKLTLVGLGLIGGSVALDLREKKFASQIIGVETNKLHGEQALNLGLVDKIESLESAVKNSDLVIISTPVDVICKLLPEILNSIGDQTTVTDMGSTKEMIAQSIVGHVKQKQFIPSHPMAGTENSGPQAALRHLFRGKTAVICNKEQCDQGHLKKVEALYSALGMRCVYMDSKQHDMHVAFVSHLSHISSFILANTVLDIERNTSTIFDLASGGFESTVRLAKSSPEMWLPIFEQNQKNILLALEAYIQHLEIFRLSVSENKSGATLKILTRANEIRRVLDTMKTKGKNE
jgi:prephenate dehydrogenase